MDKQEMIESMLNAKAITTSDALALAECSDEEVARWYAQTPPFTTRPLTQQEEANYTHEIAQTYRDDRPRYRRSLYVTICDITGSVYEADRVCKAARQYAGIEQETDA